MTGPTTRTLEVTGATLTYDVRDGDGTGDAPPLFLLGSPMGAAGFTTLAGHFGDRTIVTYDPRGVERSVRDDDADPSTPDEHADDLHRLIVEVGAPLDVFASSGGAVNALALVARHPDDVRTLVAHEPPAAQVLPDRDAALAATTAIHDTYVREGFGAGMARFIALVSTKGPIPDTFASGPGPDPATFGLPTDDDGSRNDPLLGQNLMTCLHHEFDVDALRSAETRIVVATGEESEGELGNRAAKALAERLGTEVVTFPSGHGGFLGGEYGQRGEPEAFAATLRRVLADGT